jgi:Rod binding domain-containing protein
MKVHNVATVQVNTTTTDSAKLTKAAGEFEALLIGQMLKSARESGGGGWFGSGEDEASSTTAGYAEEQFAQTMASKGGLGISTMLVKGLAADQERLNVRP